MLKRFKKFGYYFFLSFLVIFSGCASVDVPNYKALDKKVRKVDVKQGTIKSTNYSILTTTNTHISLSTGGYDHRTSSSNTGSLVLKKVGNKIFYIGKMKIPSLFSSKILGLKYTSDKCGNNISYPDLKILNKDGSVNFDLTNRISDNKQIVNFLNFISNQKNIFACSKWRVGEVRNIINFFNTLMSFNISGDKLSFIPISIPIKYNGVVTYKKRPYYYFTIRNGKARIDSKNFNDDIADFKISADILVNSENFIAEYLTISLNGNMWSNGYNFNIISDTNYEYKKIVNK